MKDKELLTIEWYSNEWHLFSGDWPLGWGRTKNAAIKAAFKYLDKVKQDIQKLQEEEKK